MVKNRDYNSLHPNTTYNITQIIVVYTPNIDYNNTDYNNLHKKYKQL